MYLYTNNQLELFSIGYVLLCDTGPFRIKYIRQDYNKYILKEILNHSAQGGYKAWIDFIQFHNIT